jgi:hypothetical protein
MHPRLEVGHAGWAVRHAGTALVEPDQPSHRAEPVQEVCVPRVPPVELEMGQEPRNQDDVAVTCPGDLVSDVQTVADGVADR